MSFHHDGTDAETVLRVIPAIEVDQRQRVGNGSGPGAAVGVGGNVAYRHFNGIVSAISEQHPLLGKYVHRYFDDIKRHLQSLRKVVTPKARCFYIVGNSKFYDTMLPVEEIYAALFEDAGIRYVGWKAIRKRNSKKELFEFVVHAVAP